MWSQLMVKEPFVQTSKPHLLRAKFPFYVFTTRSYAATDTNRHSLVAYDLYDYDVIELKASINSKSLARYFDEKTTRPLYA